MNYKKLSRTGLPRGFVAWWERGFGCQLIAGVGNSGPKRVLLRLLSVCCVSIALNGGAGERELIRDPHFEQGFYLLEPKPGRRVVYGQLPGLGSNSPAWDLAQWSSKFPLRPEHGFAYPGGLICSNTAKCITVDRDVGGMARLSMGVNAAPEYPQARKSGSEPWVHLLVQQDFVEPPDLESLSAFRFRLEARLNRSELVRTNDYSPSRHAAQFLVYLTVANRNPQAPGYQECFWFGIPVYDNRERIVSAYEAQDFGDTKLFICTPASDTFARQSTHDRQWVAFEKDLLPLIRTGLEHAKEKGFIKGSTSARDFRPLGIFIGWEVPGVFDVELQIRNLSLKALVR